MSLPPLLPGEVVVHEETVKAGQGMLALGALLAILGVVWMMGDNFAIGLVVAALGGYVIWRSKQAAGKRTVAAVVTNRRVMAVTKDGSDEILLDRLEIVQMNREGVKITGAGGIQFGISSSNPTALRDAITKAKAGA